MMSEKLRPCPNPWCKTNRPQRIRTELTFAGVVRSRVECTCGVKGPRCDTEEEAVAAWNHRPVEDALVEALKKTRNAMIAVKEEFGGQSGPIFMAVLEEANAALRLAKEGRNGR